MLDNRKLIWQPIGLYDNFEPFEIIVERKFCKKLLENTLEKEAQQKINEKTMKDTGLKPSTIFSFYNNTPLVNMVNLDPGRGKWANIDVRNDLIEREIMDEERISIKYITHNIDNDVEFLHIIRLFSSWYGQISFYGE